MGQGTVPPLLGCREGLDRLLWTHQRSRRARPERIDRGTRLLDDLGWERHGDRDVYYLTLPADQLAAWLRDLREDVKVCLSEAAEGLRDPVATWGYYGDDVAEQCERAIVDEDLELLTEGRGE